MATVPPADRTSPSLDPRYDPVFQRGYADPSGERRADARPQAPVPASAPLSAGNPPTPKTLPPAPTAASSAPPFPADAAPPLAGQPDQQRPAEEQAPPQEPRRLRTGPLWLVSALLVVGGVLLHFTSAATGYGTDWSVFTQDGTLRFADGRSVEQVLAAQLAVAVAPQLVVLGVATAVATLFLHILRSERGTR
ncbi:hypothetical protein [Naasia sp. SYSU D00057]|uniref:hypothetical protein n=1 Tax=Naasia sp. SYSU D00057 TaxID=2817380 RepID=UPI001B315697|nr:hypothetical protein [Naasia sp. SYSU D00057]